MVVVVVFMYICVARFGARVGVCERECGVCVGVYVDKQPVINGPQPSIPGLGAGMVCVCVCVCMVCVCMCMVCVHGDTT